MDWSLCFICQMRTGEALQCPANTKRKDVGAGYSSFAQNLLEFEKIGSIPGTLDVDVLRSGQGMEQNLFMNKASWHKSCREMFSNTKLERARKRKIEIAVPVAVQDDKEELLPSSPVKARRSSCKLPRTEYCCFFCDLEDNSSNLHTASTFEVDQNVRRCANIINDNTLLTKLAAGDMIAIEARYHTRCLVSLYNRARQIKIPKVKVDVAVEENELAFAELVANIEESLETEVPAVLKLSNLVKVYASSLQEHELPHENVNSTRLRERILAAFPDLTAHTQGREVLLALKHEIGDVLMEAKENKDSIACCLAKAARTIRKDILQVKNTFDGTFAPECQKHAVPASLKTLVKMILKGTNNKADHDDDQACLTISQLIVFNSISKVREKSESTGSTHHSREKECPLPIYTAIKIHGVTRSRVLLDSFYKLGMSISYDRLLSISTDTANSIVKQYENEGVVCPFKPRKEVFTTGAVDNIDHNPSSTTSKDSFHGTAISLAQHPTTQNPGKSRDIALDMKSSNSKKIAQLPDNYTEVPPLVIPSQNVPVLGTMSPTSLQATSIESIAQEKDWLEECREVLSKDALEDEDIVSWSAYRSSKLSLPFHQPAVISLLPMFTDNAHSFAMIAHSITVIREAIQHLNPSQIPVVALDQPLFALAKQIQWFLGGRYSEENLVVMLGGLHIEMAAFKALGRWLEGSGWKEALIKGEVASEGIADSFLSARHLTRTRRAHQVTAVSLYILMRKAYDEYAARDNSSTKSFEEWREETKMKCPQFQYWATVLELELLCLQFVRSIREGNFALYVKAIRQLLPWMFALDCQNYSRWLSVHYRDMKELETKHPSVFTAFNLGFFVVHKTKKLFSAIALDHAHEQVNAEVKGEGGAVGLTESVAALRRWMVAGPEMARMIEEFECIGSEEETTHHELTTSVQKNFAQDVLNLTSSIEELGNPFTEEGQDLIAIHSKDIMDASVVCTVRNAKKIGEEQCNQFLKERLVEKTKTMSDTLKKNNLPTFGKQFKKTTKDKKKLTVLKEDCALFGRLYVACQTRDGNLEEFFRYENQPWPPSLSQMGELRSGNKSDLVKCLPRATTDKLDTPDVVILDGAVVVQMLTPSAAGTFEDYFNEVFAVYILRELEKATRVDLVFDVYRDDSLKRAAREKRGFGQRRKVLPLTRIPSDWKGFLRVDENKTELFSFLAKKVVSLRLPPGKEIYSTDGSEVLCSSNRSEMDILQPCSHEEADTRLMVHVLDASLCGFRRIKIRTNDSDVVMLAISVVQTLPAGTEVWLAHGPSKQVSYLPAHQIAETLGEDKAAVLPLFHAFTGCDTVSFFGGRGKKTAWGVWSVFPDLTPVLKALKASPENVSDEHMAVIERYVVLLYDRTSNQREVNKARQELFSKKCRSLDSIPPTKDSLLQHVKRAVFQGSYVWGQTLLKQPVLPSPALWGWKRDDCAWVPLWTMLPQAKDTCYELIKCGCKGACKGRCRCIKANLACTGLCNCGGSCDSAV